MTLLPIYRHEQGPEKARTWPAIKKTVNHGNDVYVVDARINGKGERRFFGTRKEAEGWQQQQRVRRTKEGISRFLVGIDWTTPRKDIYLLIAGEEGVPAATV